MLTTNVGSMRGAHGIAEVQIRFEAGVNQLRVVNIRGIWSVLKDASSLGQAVGSALRQDSVPQMLRETDFLRLALMTVAHCMLCASRERSAMSALSVMLSSVKHSCT